MFKSCVCAIVFLMSSVLFAQSESVEAASAPSAPSDSVSAMSDQFFASNSLSFRDRRRLGLTIPNMANALRDLQKDGELEPDMDRALVAAMVFERLAANDPKSYSEVDLDIDVILAFIEKMLPIIMTILKLFSYMPSMAQIGICFMLPIGFRQFRRDTHTV